MTDCNSWMMPIHLSAQVNPSQMVDDPTGHRSDYRHCNEHRPQSKSKPAAVRSGRLGHSYDYNARMARMQISLGRMLVSVTLFALTYWAFTWMQAINLSAAAPPDKAVSLVYSFALCYSLVLIGIGNLFSRAYSTFVVGWLVTGIVGIFWMLATLSANG
jgi:hypothetical protein